jgi:multiple antibiotic resistance protein
VLEAVQAFLLGFPALFSIVNPISGGFIFRSVTASRTPEARAKLARLVAVNSLGVMMGALWAGSYVVALSGWRLLNAPETHDARKQEQAASAEGFEDIALFPLTIPFTTGPGTISVAVALGAGHPSGFAPLGWFFLGMTAAAVAMTVVIWVTYTYADRLTQLMGPTGTRTITRMSAFLLLCIGVQILISGVQDVLGPMLAAR